MNQSSTSPRLLRIDRDSDSVRIGIATHYTYTLPTSPAAGRNEPMGRSVKHQLAFVGLIVFVSCELFAIQTPSLPGAIKDQEFWQLIADLSETGGTFPQQFMSNEDSAQFVIPSLKDATKKGGVYIGVGSEQNFTYIAAI